MSDGSCRRWSRLPAARRHRLPPVEIWIAMLIAAPITGLIGLAVLIIYGFCEQWAEPKLRGILKRPDITGRLQRRRDRILYRIGILITALGILSILAYLQALVGDGIKGGPVSAHVIEAATATTIAVGCLILIIWWFTARSMTSEAKTATSR